MKMCDQKMPPQLYFSIVDDKTRFYKCREFYKTILSLTQLGYLIQADDEGELFGQIITTLSRPYIIDWFHYS